MLLKGIQMIKRKLDVEQLEERCTPSGFGKELTVVIDPPPKAVGIVTTVTLPAHAAIQVVEHNPNASFGKPVKEEPKAEEPKGKEILVSINPPPKAVDVVTTVSLPAHAAIQVVEHNPNADFAGKPEFPPTK
jgi:hypothetical protein